MDPEQQNQPGQETQEANLPPPAALPEKVGPDYWQKPKRSKLIYVAIVLVLLIAAAAYWFLLKPKPASKTSQTQSAQITQPKALITVSTANYNSSIFNLSFNYPKDWVVTDTAGSGKLTVVSPALLLKAANGQQVTGQIDMTIRDKTQKLPEFDKGAAVAVRDSEKIAYTNPTQNQRASTYISFLQYATTTGGGSLDGIYISGDNGYQKGQYIPLTDISKSDPVIDITFTKCADSKCSGNGTTLSLSQTAWDNDNFSKPLTNLLESLSIN